MRKTQGFTLVELLIGLFLMGLILVFVGSLINSSAQDTNRITSNADVIKDGQIAQQLIAGRLSEAIYVWLPGSPANINMTGTGVTTVNTVGGTGQQWRVNTDPFVAMVLPPRSPTYDAAGINITNCTSLDPSAGTSAGCYRFFAYYPMLRSALTSSSLAQTEKPKADPANNNQWVLMEYRAMLFDSAGSGAWSPNYTTDAGGSTTKRITGYPPAIYYQSRSGVLLVDYVQPNSVTFTVTRPNGVATGTALANGTVNFSFKMQRLVGSSALRATGSAADTLGAVISPRNWVCPRLVSCP